MKFETIRVKLKAVHKIFSNKYIREVSGTMPMSAANKIYPAHKN